jgi:hypothetical protein
MKARALPPYEALQELLHYDPETGTLTWKQSRGRVSKGQVAGSLGNRGYLHVRCFGRLWLAHRIAWKLQTGAEPKAGLVIDHLNGDRADNRWANIRLTTQSVNLGRREVPAGVNPRHLYSYAPGRYTVRVGSGDDILRRNGLTFNEAVALAAEWRLLRYGTA